MAKYDRIQAWDKNQVKKDKDNFNDGFNLVVHAWDWKIYDKPVKNTAAGKGIRAGVIRCKEMEMEQLLTGVKADPYNELFVRYKKTYVKGDTIFVMPRTWDTLFDAMQDLPDNRKV